MFSEESFDKIIILQRLYNLSDEQMEFQLNDRFTFKRFVGLEFSHGESHTVADCIHIGNPSSGIEKTKMKI
jgi:hypothetical protein